MRRLVAVVAALSTLAAVTLIGGAGSAAADPSADDWYQLRMCESTNNYAINTGNGYYGAYQFDLSTWESVGGTGYPNKATKEEQDYRALYLYRMRGWSPWTCATLVGLHDDADAGSGIIPPRGSGGNPPVKVPPVSRVPAFPGTSFRQGDTSDSLKVWQKQMGALGYGLTGTGFFGAKTEAAALALQAKAGLTADGVVGPLTWAAAWNTANKVGGTPPPVYTPPTDADCHVGSKTPLAWPGVVYREGDTARGLQCFQKQLGFRGYGLSGTGYYGELTKSAVLALQKSIGHKRDALIGPLTWRAAWTSR